MGEQKEIHFPVAKREAVVNRQINSFVEIGVKTSKNFELGDKVTIFSEKEPLAEGIVKFVRVTQVTNIIDEWVEEAKKYGMQMNKTEIFDKWKMQVKEKDGTNLSPKDTISVIEWEYADSEKGE